MNPLLVGAVVIWLLGKKKTGADTIPVATPPHDINTGLDVYTLGARYTRATADKAPGGTYALFYADGTYGRKVENGYGGGLGWNIVGLDPNGFAIAVLESWEPLDMGYELPAGVPAPGSIIDVLDGKIPIYSAVAVDPRFANSIQVQLYQNGVPKSSGLTGIGTTSLSDNVLAYVRAWMQSYPTNNVIITRYS